MASHRDGGKRVRAIEEFAMSDAGQQYFELCAAFGKTPDEMAEIPGPARYFLSEAHRERNRRTATTMDETFDT